MSSDLPCWTNYLRHNGDLVARRARRIIYIEIKDMLICLDVYLFVFKYLNKYFDMAGLLSSFVSACSI